MLRSILYVSSSAFVYSSEQEPRLHELVQQSQAWNQSVGITGALVCTERNFVQFIEGPSDAISDLFGKLCLDRRHTRITVIQDTKANNRHFANWSLAYSGPDAFIDYDLAPIVQNQTEVELPDLAVELRTRLQAMANA
jgi:hypothetical protein